MRVAVIQPGVRIFDNGSYFNGWMGPLSKHTCIYYNISSWALDVANDGSFDLAFVVPGMLDMWRDFSKRTHRSTPFVLMLEEDMHLPIDYLRTACDYYDYVFLFSELNMQILHSLGRFNAYTMLPCVDPAAWYLINRPQHFDVSFFGRMDPTFDICGTCRRDYVHSLDMSPHIINRYIDTNTYPTREFANTIYNESKMCLDLPISQWVTPRTFQAGVSQAAILMPFRSDRPTLWREEFKANEDYIEFDNGVQGLFDTILKWRFRTEELARISKNMRTKLLARHTFQCRWDAMMRLIGLPQ